MVVHRIGEALAQRLQVYNQIKALVKNHSVIVLAAKNSKATYIDNKLKLKLMIIFSPKFR